MLKVSFHFYYGPSSGFNKQVYEDSDNVLEFQKLVRALNPPKNDEEADLSVELDQDYDCLAVDSTDYAILTKSGENGIHTIIEACARKFSIKTVYLQNPTKLIINNMKNFAKIHTLCTLKTIKHKYVSLTKTKMRELSNNFNDKILCQEHVKPALLSTLYSIYKKRNDNKPIVLMFYGASGVGKTETAKLINSALGSSKLFRSQLSMYQNNKHFDYLFGSEINDNSFAADLLNRESKVILLDEFDKVNHAIHSAFYQIFDEGIYDDINYNVSLENSIIICTSNYKTLEEIKANIGSPLFYRFDKLIEFKSFDYNASNLVIDVVYEDLYQRLDAKEKDIIDQRLNKDSVKGILLEDVEKVSFNYRRIRNLINSAVNTVLWDEEFVEKQKTT